MQRHLTIYNDNLESICLYYIDSYEADMIINAAKKIHPLSVMENFESITLDTNRLHPLNRRLKPFIGMGLRSNELDKGFCDRYELYHALTVESINESFLYNNTKVIIDKYFYIKFSYQNKNGETFYTESYHIHKILGHTLFDTSVKITALQFFKSLLNLK